MFKIFASAAGCAAVVAFSAGMANASENDARTQASATRPVLICASDTATRRAFTREYGAAPVFVTAREALSVRPTDAVWSSPRCMTAREHSAYIDARTNLAVVR